jgi:hypothetical protein
MRTITILLYFCFFSFSTLLKAQVTEVQGWPHEANCVFSNLGPNVIAVDQFGGVFRADTATWNWVSLPLLDSCDYFIKMFTDKQRGIIIFSGEGQNKYKYTTDSGLTWSETMLTNFEIYTADGLFVNNLVFTDNSINSVTNYLTHFNIQLNSTSLTQLPLPNGMVEAPSIFVERTCIVFMGDSVGFSSNLGQDWSIIYCPAFSQLCLDDYFNLYDYTSSFSYKDSVLSFQNHLGIIKSFDFANCSLTLLANDFFSGTAAFVTNAQDSIIVYGTLISNSLDAFRVTGDNGITWSAYNVTSDFPNLQNRINLWKRHKVKTNRYINADGQVINNNFEPISMANSIIVDNIQGFNEYGAFATPYYIFAFDYDLGKFRRKGHAIENWVLLDWLNLINYDGYIGRKMLLTPTDYTEYSFDGGNSWLLSNDSIWFDTTAMYRSHFGLFDWKNDPDLVVGSIPIKMSLFSSPDETVTFDNYLLPYAGAIVDYIFFQDEGFYFVVDNDLYFKPLGSLNMSLYQNNFAVLVNSHYELINIKNTQYLLSGTNFWRKPLGQPYWEAAAYPFIASPNDKVPDWFSIGSALVCGKDEARYLSYDDGFSWINLDFGCIEYSQNENNLSATAFDLYTQMTGGLYKTFIPDSTATVVTYVDMNDNNLYDGADYISGGLKLGFTGNDITAYSNNYGYLTFPVDLFQNIEQLYYGSFQQTGQVYNIPQPYDTIYIPYKLQNLDSADIQAIFVELEPFRPGFENSVLLLIRNLSPNEATNLKVQMNQLNTRLVTLNESEPLTTTMVADSFYSWNIENLPPFSSQLIKLQFYTPDTTSLQTVITHFITLQDQNDETLTYDNTYSWSEVVGSYDPNDKLCSPGQIYTPAMLANARKLDYTIRFQNTGTFLAEKVIIRDTLNTAFIEDSTLIVHYSTHDMEVKVTDGHIIEFKFDHIMLPDSASDQAGSKGLVRFSVRPKTDLVLGNQIPNTAHIYFDFNLPIVTNTTLTSYAEVATSDYPNFVGSMKLSPNPTSSFTSLEWTELDDPSSCQIVLTDITGRLVKTYNLPQTSAGSLDLDLSSRPNGMYLVSLFYGHRALRTLPLIVRH